MLDANKNPIFLLSQSDIGAGKRGAAQGPMAVKKELEILGLPINEFEVLDNLSFESGTQVHKYGKHIEELVTSMNILNEKIVQIISNKRFPILLSGDHSNAIGGLSGLKNAYPDKRIGVIWIDAHADLHSPYTTPSGNLHGMPLAALAGLDNLESKKNEVDEAVTKNWELLKSIGGNNQSPKFDIKDLVFIGLRDVEEEEWNIIENKSVFTFEPDDIREKGIEKVLSETLEYLAGCDLLYVSFDADSLDPAISTGTGTTAPDGLNMEQAKIIFKTFMGQTNLGAFEITEVNPSLDTNSHPMAKVVGELAYYGLMSK